MTADAHTHLFTTLARLEQVLVDEDTALRRFDAAGIARAAEAKAELEPVLHEVFTAVTSKPTAALTSPTSGARGRRRGWLARTGRISLETSPASMRRISSRRKAGGSTGDNTTVRWAATTTDSDSVDRSVQNSCSAPWLLVRVVPTK